MIRFLLAFLLVTAVHADIDTALARAAEQASMNGSRLVQQTIEQDEHLLDAFPPAPCYAEWWSLHRSAISMLGEAMRYATIGDSASAEIALNAARTARWFAQEERVAC